MKKLLLCLLVFAFFGNGSIEKNCAHADPIPGLFATGVDGLGMPLADWSVDPHWVLTPPGGSGYSSIAFANNPRPASWVANTPGSRWISPEQGADPALPGNYLYTTTIDLTGFDPSSVVIDGSWAADDASSILVNGLATGEIHSGGVSAFSFFDNFVLDSSNSSFTSGLNTISFRVQNIDGATGLHVGRIKGDGLKAVPEPASIGVGIGLLGFICLRRRRQNPRLATR